MEIAYAEDYPVENLLNTIIPSTHLHAKWLNTLSYLENCGARKIARCEHPTKVQEEMLKHAAEEFRHAFSLKQQIKKISPNPFESYHVDQLLGGACTLHYLHHLDLAACRHLKHTHHLQGNELKKLAYLLVTYMIEQRAAHLYPLYEACLRKHRSAVRVKAIILEEDEHLLEMQKELSLIPASPMYLEHLKKAEAQLFCRWLEAVHLSVASSMNNPKTRT